MRSLPRGEGGFNAASFLSSDDHDDAGVDADSTAALQPPPASGRIGVYTRIKEHSMKRLVVAVTVLAAMGVRELS